MSIFSKKFLKWIKNSNVVFVLRGPFENKKHEYISKLDNIGNNKFKANDDTISCMEQYIAYQYKHLFIDIPDLDPGVASKYIEVAKNHFYMAICPDFRDSDSVKSSKISKGDSDLVSEDLGVYFSGWFLSDNNQSHWHKTGGKCFDEMLQISAISDQLAKEIESEDFKKYYHEQEKRLHVTAKFLGDEADPQYEAEARGSLCRMSDVTITGLLLTPRTFSCHVELPETDRALWDDECEHDFTLKPHITLAVGGSTLPVQSGPDQVQVQTLIRDKVAPKASYETSLGRVDDYGQCRFYLVLPEHARVSAMFNFMY